MTGEVQGGFQVESINKTQASCENEEVRVGVGGLGIGGGLDDLWHGEGGLCQHLALALHLLHNHHQLHLHQEQGHQHAQDKL